jgi:hypothetical protein
VFDPAKFVPTPETVKASTPYPCPYQLAWKEAHSGKSLSDAIESVGRTLGVPYDLASSLVWAEMSSPAPVLPAQATRRARRG